MWNKFRRDAERHPFPYRLLISFSIFYLRLGFLRFPFLTSAAHPLHAPARPLSLINICIHIFVHRFQPMQKYASNVNNVNVNVCMCMCFVTVFVLRCVRSTSQFRIWGLIRFNSTLPQIYCLEVMILKWEIRNGKNHVLVWYVKQRNIQRNNLRYYTIHMYIHTFRCKNILCIQCLVCLRQLVAYHHIAEN